jgi:lipid-A-disaccharide synthase
MKYYIIAGEASGDLHGSNLMKAIKRLDKYADFRFQGGDLMQAQSENGLFKHYRDADFMGFAEVLQNLRAILRNLSNCKKDIIAYSPDVLILIDYPGFNLRIAKWAKKQGLKIVYYISPQVWAWKAGRVKTIRRVVDKMCVILPFEQDFYTKYDYAVHYVGHPLLDAIKDRNAATSNDFLKRNQLSDKPIIAILPGSRGQEIRSHLMTMLEMVNCLEDYQFVIAGAPAISLETYQNIIKNFNQTHQTAMDVPIVHHQTYDLLAHSYLAIVASGTATLETALFNVPQVVCYKGSRISYEIAKRIVSIKYISLVNLILDKAVVTELIQHDFNAERLKSEIDKLLDTQNYEAIQNEYAILHQKLGSGSASDKVARIVFDGLVFDRTSVAELEK